MKLTFHGTRGEIEATSLRHRRHSALEIAGGVEAVIAHDGMEVVV